MKINNENIEFYLDKFLEGETDREEEKALSEYFHTAGSVPSGLEGYKAMFEWIDAGMPEEETVNKGKKRRWLKSIPYIGSAAVVAVVIVTLLVSPIVKGHKLDPEVIYAGSYVCHSGVKESDIKTILPEIESTLKQVDEMEKKIENLDFDIWN